MKKNCELCKSVARTHCESDQADLCWTCDYKVHAANFLVARHSRTLLCHVCQSTTPWSATGTRIGTTVSVCNSCVRGCDTNKGITEDDAEYEEKYEGSEVGVESDSSSDEGVETSSDDDEEEEEEEADKEDNQVVPWSPTTPPPAVSSSSNSDGESDNSSSSSSRRDQRKRTHENVSDLRLNANQNRSSNRGNASSPPVTGSPAVACTGGERGRCERNLKRRRFDGNRVGHLSPKSTAIVEYVKRLQRQEMRSSAAVAEFCRLSED